MTDLATVSYEWDDNPSELSALRFVHCDDERVIKCIGLLGGQVAFDAIEAARAIQIIRTFNGQRFDDLAQGPDSQSQLNCFRCRSPGHQR